ncbi:k antiporter p-type alpha subunit family protein [Stylonychia lemnae]|uniref:K antiporter P-type alpha subunit family protein n=1 Tax=Stylonychia lemnae TaxID=5949 RepID=A0A078AFL0_STYLE|nr:k antiporter p-type alpha subunit family protein [Stylonychia lemnae]|eukprot:CDW80621.1 k antiporter p-type alpha subunit family protein [Stylonychia lemnae]
MSKVSLNNQSKDVSIFYEQLVQEYQRQELVLLATVEKNDLKISKSSGISSAVNGTEKIRTWNEHMIETEQLAQQLETCIKARETDKSYFGLTQQQAHDKLKTFGLNQLTEKKGIPWFVQYLLLMTGLFNYMLWAGSTLSFVAYGVQDDKRDKTNMYLGVVLIGVVFITATMSYIQQSKAAALMAQFKDFIPTRSTVFRNGQKIEINASELVPGDIVEIQIGANIPADVVLIQASEMKVNNASLTGESEDLLRVPEERSKNIFESPNVAFFGTACTNGNGVGIVFKTGDSTVIGQIANLAQTADAGITPISIEIDRFIKIIATISFSMSLTFFAINFAFGYQIITNIIFMIGIIVANTPEGLYITLTVCMALAAKRMAARSVLVKNLQSVETLGSTSCICSDKTGTLTQNRMTVSHLYYNAQIHDASINYEKLKKNQELKLDYDIKDPAFKNILDCMILGSKASFAFNPKNEEIKAYIAKKKGSKIRDYARYIITEEEKEQARQELLQAELNLPVEKRNVTGDASETGIIKFAQSIRDVETERQTYPVFSYELDGNIVDALIPFNSEIKFNMFIRDMNTDKISPESKEDNLCIFLKGAPERILNRCNKILINGEERPFSQYADHVQFANYSFGRMGERVLAFAKLELDPKIYKKNPKYQFDVKNWKQWQHVKDRDSSIQGWFPMFNLTLVGIVSLNDPPRPRVDLSVLKCRQAGIKVIMVTGDQPPTAAAIAHKVNIITDPTQEYHYLRQEKGLSHDQAMEQSKAIVIHGDLLAEKHAEEEFLDDLDPDKGRFLTEWISKPEVVFARTTPSQKLLIVDACQKAGHIVAVTGDGVNDSPAIKKADIGIAMGSGSDVAKNAADIILLNDDFSSIVMGVEQGRLMFDNLKKSIQYALSANTPAIFSVLCNIVIQVPVPLSSILMIAICLGTDMYPAIALAYENAELDIMERLPRNQKRDRLVPTKLMSFSYVQTGTIQALSGMFAYFYILNDFGFKFNTLINLNLAKGYEPNPTDIYDPNLPNFGNTNFGIKDYLRTIAWGRNYDAKIDVRLFFVHHNKDSWGRCRWNPNDESIPRFWRYSNVTEKQLCYTPEAVIYVSSAYFVGVVITQIANNIISKTRTLSLSQQQLINSVQWQGFIFELSLAILICYAKPFEIGLGGRQLASPHFGIPAMSFFMIIVFYDEVRKILVRKGIDTSIKGKIKLNGWMARNTIQ